MIYDKHSGELFGFIDVGDVLLAFQQSCESDFHKPQLATHMLVFMVCGILSALKYPYAQFPCMSVTADQLYSLVWGGVRRLLLEKWFPLRGERAYSLKLLCMYNERFEISKTK